MAAVDFQAYLNLVQAIGALEESLLQLRRISRGALASGSKANVGRMVRRFVQQARAVRGLPADLMQVVTNMDLLAQGVTDETSDDDGGYKRMTRNFEELLVAIGFVKGILYHLYETCRPKPKARPAKEDDEDDEDNLPRQFQAMQLAV